MKPTILLVACACVIILSLTGCAKPADTPSAGSTPASNSGTAAEATTTPSDSGAPSGGDGSAAGKTTPGAEQGKTYATLAKFNQVKKGMDLAAVRKIMGTPGLNIGEGGSGNIKVAMYAWYGADNTTAMTVNLGNGIVTAKAQRGLK